jgi:hypothetical protein
VYAKRMRCVSVSSQISDAVAPYRLVLVVFGV